MKRTDVRTAHYVNVCERDYKAQTTGEHSDIRRQKAKDIKHMYVRGPSESSISAIKTAFIKIKRLYTENMGGI